MNYKDTKDARIKLMFFTLKTLAILFSSIPYFQYFYSILKSYDEGDYLSTILTTGIAIVIICVVVFLWTSLSSNEMKPLSFQGAEIAIFFTLFIFAIYFSGAHESYYKFVFLFIIISYTIEYGMKAGILLSTISSVIILAIDLIFGEANSLNTYFQNDLALSAMFIIVAWTLGFYVKLENSHIEQLTEYANIDGLTGLYNHRYFHEYLSNIFKTSVSGKESLSLIMFDIDYFKNYNDLFGHQKGDVLLRNLAGIVKKKLRASDVFCRYGGDEFCVILHGTTNDTAYNIAQRIRSAVMESEFEGMESLPDKHLTISVGVVSLSEHIDSYTTLLENADMALYKAKFLRKNRVEVYSSVFELNELDSDKLKSLKALITVINSRDTYTYKHVERVVDYCSLMAKKLKLSADDRKCLIYSAYLHDLGKINIPKEILIKETAFTDEEWAIMKAHPKDSADIVSQIEGFQDTIPVIMQHHEKYNGTGYPNGLSGESISYLGRILTLADCFDAMTSLRPYQKTKSFEEAFAEIERCKGTQFDPDLADLFIECIKAR